MMAKQSDRYRYGIGGLFPRNILSPQNQHWRAMKKIDVGSVLDAAPLRGLPLLVILCTTLILVLDGLDIQIISLVAPLLTKEFHIAPATLGPVLAAALIGMALGGFALGALGDRFGRRLTLLLSVALFAAATLMGATTQSIAVLALWRLLTGIGLGGAIPNAIALLAEFTGPRWRTQAVAAAVIGVPVGGMCGALIASYVLPHLGWRAMFAVGGLLPCAAFGVIYFLLPESPRYLATRPELRKPLVAVLNRLAGAGRYSEADAFELLDSVPRGGATDIDGPPRKSPAAGLLRGPLLRETCGLWLIFLTNMFTIYTFFSWSPVILGSLGLPLAVAVRGSIVFNLAGVCGGCISAWLLARMGSRLPTAALAAVGMVTLWVISRLLGHAMRLGSAIDVTSLMSAIAVVGFVMIGIQTAAYRLSVHLYPTQIRASGVGWAAAWGRLGGILSSLIAGWLLARVHGAGLFALLSCVIFFTLVGILMIRRHLSPIRLQGLRTSARGVSP
jgi:AAHS family 4-hydroxybenzoate transporter-like MFS transporter